jgi:phosphoglycolate phosphatase
MFLRSTGTADVFRDFECWGNSGLAKTHNLERLVARNALRAPVLVGDTPGDETAARDCRIPFLYVDYGFADCTDFTARFSSFTALTDWLLTS